MTSEPKIVDPNGKEVQSAQFADCPKCGRPAKDRLPSGGFGEDVFLLCPCGFEFKEIKWQTPSVI